MRKLLLSTTFVALLGACNGSGQADAQKSDDKQGVADISPVDREPFTIDEIASFDEPWALDFMPGGSKLFVTEKRGAIRFVDMKTKKKGTVEGDIPEVDYGGQGGLGDFIFGDDWIGDDGKAKSSGTVYLSWVEAGESDTRGAAVARAKLSCDKAESCTLSNVEEIWQQQPKVTGRGHFSHRLLLSPDGEYLFISSGERQKKKPAQSMDGNLGKIIRIRPDGSIPDGNPFADREGPIRAVWSLGHRNILGLAFDSEGHLWDTEMGPKGGDELNYVQRGANYGWPLYSNGVNYDGTAIPDHPAVDAKSDWGKIAGGATHITPPAVSWVPSISPANLLFYDGDLFKDWKNSLFIGGLSGQVLIRVTIEGEKAEVANRWPMDERIRDVGQGPDGALWLLTDGEDGKLLRLTPPGE